MKKLGSQGGFTLIELVMVIVILGILAAVAIPKFIDLRDDARKAAEDGVVAGVRGGIAIWHAAYLVGKTGYTDEYPTALDSASDGSASDTNEFFDAVLDYGITDPDWSKAVTTYTGPATGTYTYTSSTGKFE